MMKSDKSSVAFGNIVIHDGPSSSLMSSNNTSMMFHTNIKPKVQKKKGKEF